MTDNLDAPTEGEQLNESPAKRATIQAIEDRVLSGERWVKQGHYTAADARWEKWKENARYLRCQWNDDWTKGEFSAFNVNTVHSNYRTKRPTLYFKNPKINARPTKPEFTRDMYGNQNVDESGHPILADNYKAGKLISVKINYELGEIGFKNVLKRTVGDNLCPYGIGWVKWGYKTLTASGHSNVRDRTTSYWCYRVDPRNVVYDWMATSMENCKWIAERIVLTRAEAQEMGFKIPAGYVPSLPDFLKDRDDKSAKGSRREESALVIIWEYHDLKAKTIQWCLVGDKMGGISKELAFSEDPYPFDGSCYEPLVLDEDHDDIIGLSDVEPIRDQALALNRMRTMEVRHFDNFGTFIVMEEGTIRPNERAKFNRTPFGATVELTQGSFGKWQVVSPPALGADHYRFAELHKEEIRTTLGITEFQQGGLGDASTKATIGSIVQNSSNLRIEEQRDVIHDFVVNCVRKLAAMIQAFSSEEEYLNLKDEPLDEDYVDEFKKSYNFNPKIPFLKMSRQDIQGEFNFEFKIEDMIVRPKEVQLQQWIQFLSTIGSNALFAQKFVQEFDIAKVIEKTAELGGIDLGEVRKGGPQMISAERENQMFINGKEVPDPHRKDPDDEHLASHGRLLRDLQSQLTPLLAQAQQMMGTMEQVMANPAAALDPAAGQAMQEQGMQIQAALQQLQEQIEPIQSMIRTVKLHMNKHEEMRAEKEDMNSMSGMSQGTEGQIAATDQAAMQRASQQTT